MPHRLPVDAGRLATWVQPSPASQSDSASSSLVVVLKLRTSRRTEPFTMCRTQATTVSLMHVETGAMWVQNLHIPSCRCASGVGSRQTNSRERAPEPSPARGAIGGAPESWVQLTDGLLAPSKTRPLCRGRCPGYYQL